MNASAVVGLVLGAVVFVLWQWWKMQDPHREARQQAMKQIVCPHCRTKGCVTTSSVVRKQGVSGGKATGALMTGGLSLFATGLSRKQHMTEASCSNCGSTWTFA